MDNESVVLEVFPGADCSAAELVSYLKGAFLRADFERAANILRMREEEWGKKEVALKAELQRVVEESKVKDERIRELVEKNEEAARREKEREREVKSLLVRNEELEDQCRKWEEECTVVKGEEWKARMEIDMLMRKEEEVETRFADLERAFAELGSEKRMVDEELEDWKRKCNKLEEDFRVVRGEVEKMKEQIKGLLEEIKKKGESSGCYTEAELKFGEVGSRTNASEKEKEADKSRCSELEASRKKPEEDNRLTRESERQSRGEIEDPKWKLTEMSHKLDQKQEVNQQPSALNPVSDIDKSSSRHPCALNLVPKTETPIECLEIEKRRSTTAGGPHQFVIDISDSDEEVDASPGLPRTSTSKMSDTLSTASYNMVESLPQGAATNLTEKTPTSSLKMPMLGTRIVASDNNTSSSNKRHILSPKIKLLSEVVAVDENDEGADRVAGRAANASGLGDLVQTSQLTSSSLTKATSKLSSNDKNYSIEIKQNVDPREDDDRILSPKRRRLSNVISDDDSDEDDGNRNSTRRTKKLLKDLLARNEHGKLNVDPATLDGGPRLVHTSQNKDSVHASSLLMDVHTAAYNEEIDASKSSITTTRKRIRLLREREEMRNTKGISSVVPADEGGLIDVKSTSSRAAGKFILENLDKQDNATESGESESLGGFIVNGSGGSEAESSSSYLSASEADDDSSSDGTLSHVLGRIQRKKGSENWEFEADMLAAFQKDDELCMKAVCALYRQQTSEEKAGKASLYHNRRGFNTLDALRGSEVAEFLTDGDPFGPLKKSAKELERHNPDGVEYCRELAMRYSKQLYEIYQKQEDPFFCPSS